MCEAMALKQDGDETLAKVHKASASCGTSCCCCAQHLNSYFELLVKVMSSQGGDVFKFAGDALLVVWPPSEEDLVTLTRRAGQCALEVRCHTVDKPTH